MGEVMVIIVAWITGIIDGEINLFLFFVHIAQLHPGIIWFKLLLALLIVVTDIYILLLFGKISIEEVSLV